MLAVQQLAKSCQRQLQAQHAEGVHGNRQGLVSTLQVGSLAEHARLHPEPAIRQEARMLSMAMPLLQSVYALVLQAQTPSLEVERCPNCQRNGQVRQGRHWQSKAASSCQAQQSWCCAVALQEVQCTPATAVAVGSLHSPQWYNAAPITLQLQWVPCTSWSAAAHSCRGDSLAPGRRQPAEMDARWFQNGFSLSYSWEMSCLLLELWHLHGGGDWHTNWLQNS